MFLRRADRGFVDESAKILLWLLIQM